MPCVNLTCDYLIRMKKLFAAVSLNRIGGHGSDWYQNSVMLKYIPEDFCLNLITTYGC
jgi:hypothetical protein